MTLLAYLFPEQKIYIRTAHFYRTEPDPV